MDRTKVSAGGGAREGEGLCLLHAFVIKLVVFDRAAV